MNNIYISGAVLILTVVINLVLAYTGTTQKLSCTIEQSAAAAAAILATPPQE